MCRDVTQQVEFGLYGAATYLFPCLTLKPENDEFQKAQLMLTTKLLKAGVNDNWVGLTRFKCVR